MRALIPVIVLCLLPSGAHAETEVSKAEIIEGATKAICTNTMSQPSKQVGLNHFGISLMALCECVVSETSYAMGSDPSATTLADYIVRLSQTGNQEFADYSEKSAWDTYMTKYNNSNSNCVHRLARR